MKKRKTEIFITLFLFSISINAQSTDSFLPKNDLLINSNLNLDSNNYSFDFKNINFQKSKFKFSSYNKTTKLNDNYLIINDYYIYNKSTMIFENNFRGHKIGSFNPYGASNISTALIFGIVGSILK